MPVKKVPVAAPHEPERFIVPEELEPITVFEEPEPVMLLEETEVTVVLEGPEPVDVPEELEVIALPEEAEPVIVPKKPKPPSMPKKTEPAAPTTKRPKPAVVPKKPEIIAPPKKPETVMKKAGGLPVKGVLHDKEEEEEVQTMFAFQELKRVTVHDKVDVLAALAEAEHVSIFEKTEVIVEPKEVFVKEPAVFISPEKPEAAVEAEITAVPEDSVPVILPKKPKPPAMPKKPEPAAPVTKRPKPAMVPKKPEIIALPKKPETVTKKAGSLLVKGALHDKEEEAEVQTVFAFQELTRVTIHDKVDVLAALAEPEHASVFEKTEILIEAKDVSLKEPEVFISPEKPEADFGLGEAEVDVSEEPEAAEEEAKMPESAVMPQKAEHLPVKGSWHNVFSTTKIYTIK